jgi:hypothetical protein
VNGAAAREVGIKVGQVWVRRDGGPAILITSPVGDYWTADGPVDHKTRAIDHATGHNPRWISPEQLATDYQLAEEQA